MPNHFDLMRAISTSRPELGALLRTVPLGDLSERITRMFDEEFRSLMNPLRAEFIQRCLDRRAKLFHEAVAKP